VNQWINKDTEIYCSFAETAGNTGCQMMNTSFYYYGLNKIYKSFSVSNIEEAVNAVKTLNINYNFNDIDENKIDLIFNHFQSLDVNFCNSLKIYKNDIFIDIKNC